MDRFHAAAEPPLGKYLRWPVYRRGRGRGSDPFSFVFCTLFNNAVRKSVYVALVTGSELDVVLKAAVVACFNILSWIVSEGTQLKRPKF
jgi:hypothetical protein